MAYPALPDPADVQPSDMPWPNRAPLAMAVFTCSIGVVIALERHEFTSPNLRWVAIALAIAPWVIEAFLITTRRIGPEHPFERPLHALFCASVISGVSWLVATYKGNDDIAPFLVALLIGEISATEGWRVGAAVWAVSVTILMVFIATEPTFGMWIWAFAFTIGWMGGVAYRRQVQIAFVLTQAQSQLAERAAEQERSRLARDVHDLVAHSLAVTMLQLSGARLALRDGETAEAIEALEEAEAAGRGAMAEIHRTVGLLGSGSGAGMAVPTPCAADLPALVGDFQRAGLTVDFDLHGDLATVPLTIGLASYRLVQESLANAVKHAPGASVQLQVRISDCDIEIAWPSTPVTSRVPPWVRRVANGAARHVGAGDVARRHGVGRQWRRHVEGQSGHPLGYAACRVITVLLVDDQQLVRAGLRRILGRAGFEHRRRMRRRVRGREGSRRAPAAARDHGRPHEDNGWCRGHVAPPARRGRAAGPHPHHV